LSSVPITHSPDPKKKKVFDQPNCDLRPSLTRGEPVAPGDASFRLRRVRTVADGCSTQRSHAATKAAFDDIGVGLHEATWDKLQRTAKDLFDEGDRQTAPQSPVRAAFDHRGKRSAEPF